MFTILAGLGLGVLSMIAQKKASDDAAAAAREANAEATAKQEALLRSQGPKAVSSQDVYAGLRERRLSGIQRGLLSTIKTSSMGLLTPATTSSMQLGGKTKLGE
jgi:hypothetical protein